MAVLRAVQVDGFELVGRTRTPGTGTGITLRATLCIGRRWIPTAVVAVANVSY